MSPHAVVSKKVSSKKTKVKSGKRVTLHHAANLGDIDKLKQMLTKGADIDALDVSGHTALHILVEYGDIECVKLLLSEGADVNIPCRDGSTAIHIAATHGLVDLLKLLLESKAQVNSQEYNGMTPLHSAVSACQTATAKLLLQKGAHVNAHRIDGRTPLHLAVAKTNDCIRSLVEEKADIYARDYLGICPLEIATEYGWEIMKKLLPRNAKLYSPDGTTPLHIAARSVNVECLKYFITEGCDVNLTTKTGDTPLHFACSMGASVHSVLKIPVQMSQAMNIELLVRAGANLNKKNHKGLAPIHVCASLSRLLSLEYLYKFGADLNLRGGEKRSSPIHIASDNGNLNCIEFLVEHGAEKNAVDRDKNTPLMLAAKKHHYDCVRYLLNQNAMLWSL